MAGSARSISMDSLSIGSTPAADKAETQAITRFCRWRLLVEDIEQAARRDAVRWRLELQLSALGAIPPV
jgi:hypothetical protein